MTRLARNGGAPVRSQPYPAWPIFGDRERNNLLQALESGVWSEPGGGPFVRQFERAFAGTHETQFGVAVTNGTVSLMLSLRALGIGAGDEVIVPPYTFLSTASTVLEVSALPVFVDIDPGTWCIDPDAVEAAITPRTRAIIPVHLGGHPADMDRLTEIARRHGLKIIEDAAHAHGAIWNGQPVGGWGDFGSFSLQASKNVTGGEGGIVTTNDEGLADRMRSLRNCGRIKGGEWYDHHNLGGNYRLTEFQAAVLVGQLDTFGPQLARRDANGMFLNAGLAEIEGIRPQQRDPRTDVHGYHMYGFRFDASAFDGVTRAEFITLLRAEGIPAGPGYPIPLNRQPLFINQAFDVRATGYDPSYAPTQFETLDLPVTTVICDEVVVLPQWVLLGDERDMSDVVTAIRKIQHEVQTFGRQEAVSFID